MFQIAVYGKGGIGKSTISANISYSLASMGKKVVQIGCDPKHDSTRLLIGGRNQNTVLDYLRHTPKEKRSLDDVIVKGAGGVRCIEAGGPEPGVGCAGRGILTMFDFLDKEGMNNEDIDFKIYDVLGDVVCGGFAVPLRKGFADMVYIVTSGEFMSLYAANNILKGLLNYKDGRPRVGGIILNERGMESEYGYVKNFADGVGLPIICRIKRDPLFAEAEANGKTVVEMFPDSEAAKSIRSIAEDIVKKSEDSSLLCFPRPIDDETMDKVAKGIPIESAADISYRRKRNPVNDCRSLKSCAGMGAVAYAARVRGIHVVVHGPDSCAYMMCAHAELATDYRDIFGDLQSVWENVTCTGLDDSSSVFGGIEKLREVVKKRASLGDKVVFVISMCVPGIIGDNITDECRTLSSELDIRVVPVQVDGISVGGVPNGRDAVIEKVMDLVKPVGKKDPGLINVLGDYRSYTEFYSVFDKSVEEMIEAAGLKINSVYPGRCRIENVREMGRAKFAVKISDNVTYNKTCDYICGRLGTVLMKEPLPKGMSAIERWLDEASSLTGKNVSLEKKRMRHRYEKEISAVKKYTMGKKAVVVSRPSDDYAWLFELLDDMGIEVLKTRETTYNRWVMGESGCASTEPYTSDLVEEDISRFNPDIAISDSMSDIHLDTRSWCVGSPLPGLDGIIDYAVRLGMVFRAPAAEGWRS